MLTMDGRCKTLDVSADGYVRSEACIVMLITATESSSTLDRGNDTTTDIMLRSTYVNQDGRSSSLTAPNGPSQQQVQSQEFVNLSPRTIQIIAFIVIYVMDFTWESKFHFLELNGVIRMFWIWMGITLFMDIWHSKLVFDLFTAGHYRSSTSSRCAALPGECTRNAWNGNCTGWSNWSRCRPGSPSKYSLSYTPLSCKVPGGPCWARIWCSWHATGSLFDTIFN